MAFYSIVIEIIQSHGWRLLDDALSCAYHAGKSPPQAGGLPTAIECPWKMVTWICTRLRDLRILERPPNFHDREARVSDVKKAKQD